MFSCSPLQPQIIAAASQLSSLLSGARVIRHSSVVPRTTHVSHQQYSLKQTKNDEQSEVKKQIEELPSLIDVCLKAQDIKAASVWQPSYSSSSSFFENRTGFPESELHRKQNGLDFLTSLGETSIQKWLHGIMFTNKPYNLNTPVLTHQQVRHFHVHRDDHKPRSKDVDADSEKPFFKLNFPSQNKQSRGKEDLGDETLNDLKIYKKGLEDGKKTKSSKLPIIIVSALLLSLIIGRLVQSGVVKFSMEDDVKKAEMVSTRFSDVKGAYEAKQELQEVVEFLRNPYSFSSLGAKLPKGVLLVGPPGNGKTLLARAVAGEAGVPFLFCSGSEFDEIFVGTGARKVRKLFKYAKLNAPCVVFIDEFDTVGAKRTSSSLQPYANQTINQLLAEMDGFEQNNGIIVLGATNKRDVLDSAVTRAGRFDVEVKVNPPDLRARKSMLEHYLSKVICAKSINMEIIAKATIGFSGADIENLVNQAALRATLDSDAMVELKHLEFALDKIRMGPAAKHKIPDKEEVQLTAHHEAGHAVVAVYTKKAMPLYKVTILPRGSSGGHNSFIPEKDKSSSSRSELLAQMDVAMGGLVAEQLLSGENQFSTGPQADLQQATAIARAMVQTYGMSNEVGFRTIQVDDQSISPNLRNKMDLAVEKLIQESYERAKQILKDHQREHKKLVNALLEHETINGEDVKNLVLNNKDIPKNYSDRLLTQPKKVYDNDISTGIALTGQ